MKQFTSLFSVKISKFIVISFFLISSNFNVFSQCGPCTTCNTSDTSGCTTTISASSSAAINASAGTKTCITAGTYTGSVTFNGGTVVVSPGAAFNPTGTNIFGGGILEIKNGATSTMNGFLGNGNSAFFTFNNCGKVNFTGGVTNNGGRVIINNNGIMTSTSTLLYNGSVAGSMICNSDTMIFTGLTLNGTNGVTLTNNGYLNVGGNMVQNGPTSNISLCCGSNLVINGNWTGNSTNTTNGVCPCTTPGKIFVSGTSVCNACHITGCADFCDTSGAAVNKCPHIDVLTGTIDTSVTTCGLKCGTASAPTVVANGGSVCVGSCTNVRATASSGTPPYTYVWNPNIGAGPGPFSVCPGNTTVYSVTVTDAAGQKATDTAKVTVLALPLVDVNPLSPKICDGQGVMLTASGGVTYTWSPTTGLSDPTIANPIANPTVTTTYTVIGTGANGCTSTATVTVKVGTTPIVNVTHSTTFNCDSGITIYIGYGPQTVTLTANTGTILATYQWYVNGVAIAGDTTKNITVSSAGSYNVIVTDPVGCASDSLNSAIEVKFVDIRCGHDLKKIIICHVPPGNAANPQTLCIDPHSVGTHLHQHPHDCLGPCKTSKKRIAIEDMTEDEIVFNAYPNPFQTETVIEFFLPDGGNARLELRDIKGTLIENLFDGVAESDHLYQIKVDGSKLAEGIYIGTLTTDEGVMHRKLIVTK